MKQEIPQGPLARFLRKNEIREAFAKGESKDSEKGKALQQELDRLIDEDKVQRKVDGFTETPQYEPYFHKESFETHDDKISSREEVMSNSGYNKGLLHGGLLATGTLILAGIVGLTADKYRRR